jgi:eukaryotic-like serine/threonine-protein kinase
MASVWLARQHGKHGFEKLVAVKTILPVYAADLRFQQMFLDEARIASGIEHPNVAQILDLGEENEVLYLAMEWVDGDSLSKLFRAAERNTKGFPVNIVCRILADTCAGLHAAHELRDKNDDLLNVVHRDISPQNVLVSTKGQAKLIDFGIAKARDRVSENTSTGFLKGKILYMAPEQALGKPVDRRADVWAVGAVLYHMLAGVPPFEGANQLATLHLLTQSDTPFPPLPASVPPQVVDVVTRTLVRDIDRRVGTADELQRMLEHAMQASGQTAIHSDVAAFVGQHLSDRVEARRKAVNLALEAAKQRQKLQQMLAPPSADSSSGLGHPLRTRHSATPSDARIAVPPSSADGFMPDDVPSSATLGSAAVVSPRPSLTPRGRKLAIVGTVMGICTLVAAMALGVTIAKAGRHEVSPAATPQTPTGEPAQAQTVMPTFQQQIPPPPTISATPTTAQPGQTAQPPATTFAPPVSTTITRVFPAGTSSTPRSKPAGTSKPVATSTKTPDDGF